MKDEAKTKEQLISELAGLRQRVAELETPEAERKQAEEALRESEAGLAKAQQIAHLGNFDWNVKDNTSYLSDEYYRIFGLSPREVGFAYEEFISHVHPDDREFVKRATEESFYQNAPHSIDYRIILPDGSERTVHSDAEVTFDEAGEPIRMVGIIQDITERKRTEEALESAEQNFRNSLDNSPLGIRIINAEGETIYANKAILDIYGYSSIEELESIPASERHTPRSYAERQERVRKRGAGEPVPDRFEQSIIRKNGEVRDLEVFNQEVLWGGEKQFQLIYHDITERKQAEEREKEMQKELNLASRLASVGELAAGVAHEINNPLTGILAFSERLLRKSTDEKASRDLKRINNEANRAARVVERLLTFARRREPEKEYLNINSVVRKALELRAYELKTGNIKVELDLAVGLPRVMVDSHQFQEVFLSIIMNAEQAITEADRGGKLSIKTQPMKDYIRISFTDDGPGIPAEQLEKIFDPFFTTRGKEGGTGLGLSVCYGIVQRHDGRIYARSKPGKGVTFIVELPMTGEKVKEAKKS